jgi:Fur family ferric uptake transcriptional regulator
MALRPGVGKVPSDGEDARERLEERLAAVLVDHGYAVTTQRRVIFSELALSTDHPTAEALYLRLRRRLPELSLATVYKNLHLLASVGLARAVATPVGKARFDAGCERHHHLRCVSCGEIVDLFDARLEVGVPEDIPVRTGFVVLDSEVQLSGVCPACQEARRRQSPPGVGLRRRSGPRRRSR